MLNLHSFTQAILHIDGDCFFAACEVAKNPALKGKPVITGAERGIVSSLTYEAKARGVTRAMRLSEVKRICPDAVILPSDYETYSLYSVRMFNIVRRYTSEVEEYSIDECFADLTGLQRPLNMSYEKIAAAIKRDLDNELGITFSVGLAPSKVLAKIGSKWQKPSGLTIIPGNSIHKYLGELEVGKVWGIGPKTSAYLNKLGIRTALDFAQKNEAWVKSKMTKPHQEIWQELRGEAVYVVDNERKSDYQSISKTKTFTPASNKSNFVFSQLSKNIENACIKARRHKLETKKIFIFLKSDDFRYYGLEAKLDGPTAVPTEIIRIAKENFGQIFDEKKSYRATGIILMDLVEARSPQLDIFGHVARVQRLFKIFASVDGLAQKYGKHTLFTGASFEAMTIRAHQNERGDKSERQNNLFRGESLRRHLSLPFLGEAV
ncbi:MAG: DNA polymerase IV [Candidatus Buchananbacteria bacterium]|jgi:DNA polymerase-4/DNA polymerase V